MIPGEWIEQADARIGPYILRTPLTYDTVRNIYLKWDNHQVTGSFKARGALNKVLTLEAWEREAGIVTASAGNHGQGVALAGKLFEVPVKVFVPQQAVAVKVKAIEQMGAQVEYVPGGYHEAEDAGIDFAVKTRKTWISPYNDGQVISGQGTLGLEILNELPAGLEMVWLVPVGGGGLISGVAAAISRLSPRPRLIGVQSEASAFMHAIYYHDTQEGVPDLPSLADGLAGAVEANAITVPLIRKYVDEIILVSEEEIAHAVAFAWQTYGEKVEGSGAVGIAAILAGKVKERPAVVVVSGGNIQPEMHAEICRRYTRKI